MNNIQNNIYTLRRKGRDQPDISLDYIANDIENLLAHHNLAIEALDWYSNGMPDGGSLAKTILTAIQSKHDPD